MPRMKRKEQYGECTLDDVAAELGLTREGARVVERRALAKMREGFIRRGIDAEAWFLHLDDLTRALPAHELYAEPETRGGGGYRMPQE